MEVINSFLGTAVGYVWGLPLVLILCGSGILFTFAFGFVQFRGFRHAIDVVRGKYDNPNDEGEISHFQALCTALSATIGLGNIAGVAVAIKIGGPGAVFWMVLVGLIGMASKFAESSLAIMYRRVDEKGVVHGGPMHYIEMGMGKAFKPLAMFFAFACICASFGAANMFQTNQVASIMHTQFGVSQLLMGIILAVLTGIVIIGGVKRIGKVTEKLIPFMALIYVGGAIVVLVSNFTEIPSILGMIITDAFVGTAAVGGFTGAAVKAVLIQGVRRACFSNEAGVGSAAIAHSAATTNEPIREGLVASLGPFIDTVVICTMTALVILISGEWMTEGSLQGVSLTASAFDSAIPGFGQYFIPFAVFLFAYSTLISWSYYGERAIDYLVGEKSILAYKIVFCVMAVVGAIWKSDAILNFSDMMLGLMVIPNMIALIYLLPKVKKATKTYFEKLKAGEFKVYK